MVGGGLPETGRRCRTPQDAAGSHVIDAADRRKKPPHAADPLKMLKEYVIN